NDEGVARAIFASEIPVISAVGHESDVSISDFVADARAETPTAAADMAVMNTFELRDEITYCREMLLRAMRQKIESERMLLSSRADLLYSNMKGKVSEARSAVDKALIMIRENDPRNIFSKGYAAVTDDQGHIVPGVEDIQEGSTYRIRMRDGSFTALASDITKEGPYNGR
ncbi:MAG: hypothetical protein IKI38_03850, partial [Mogibacterium sp.]|nr:hypothetical protein [Mogibacterium sp.]